MLNFKMLKPLGAILRKLGVVDVMEEFAQIDLEQEDAQTALGMKAFALVCENLERCADDIISLCAAYKGVTAEEMAEQDPLVVLTELFKEESFGDFIKPLLARAASKKS